MTTARLQQVSCATAPNRHVAERSPAVQSIRTIFSGMPELAAFHARLDDPTPFSDQERAEAEHTLAQGRAERQAALFEHRTASPAGSSCGDSPSLAGWRTAASELGT